MNALVYVLVIVAVLMLLGALGLVAYALTLILRNQEDERIVQKDERRDLLEAFAAERTAWRAELAQLLADESNQRHAILEETAQERLEWADERVAMLDVIVTGHDPAALAALRRVPHEPEVQRTLTDRLSILRGGRAAPAGDDDAPAADDPPQDALRGMGG